MQNQLVFPIPDRRPARPMTRLACVLGALTLTLSACEKTAEDAAPAPAADAGLQQLLAMGFKQEHIADKGTYFLVEGDIVINKSQLTLAAAPATRSGTVVGQQNQVSLNSLIRFDEQPNITVRIDPSLPAQWRGDAEQAIRDWNGIPNARVDLTLVADNAAADITIFGDPNTPGGATATGSYPFDGIPGSEIRVQTVNNQSRSIRRTLVHELGHTLGFHHTDQSVVQVGVNGQVVPGTPGVGQDPTSVMNSFSLPWTGFTQYDVIAFQNMYPGARNRLYSNEELRQNQEIRSANGQYRLTLQPDGNLVLYRNGTQALWASGTSGRPEITRCAMQIDGNLVLYDNNNRAY